MGLVCIAFLEERESVEKLWRMKDGLAYTFSSSMKAVQTLNFREVLP